MTIYIIVLLVVLALIAVFIFVQNKQLKTKQISPLAGLAFVVILSSLLFGEDRLIGYGLMGFGILLALLDMFNNSRGKSNHI